MSLADCIRREKGTKDPSEVDTLCLDQAKCGDGLAPLEPFKGLLSLSIQDAGISSLDSMPALENLTELKMSDNKIKGGLDNLLRLPNLERLYLAGNQISTLESIEKLSALSKLELLDLEHNPVTKVDGYQASVFKMFGSLIALDGKNRDGEEIEEFDEDEEDDEDDEDDEGDEDDDEDDDEGRPRKSPFAPAPDDDEEDEDEDDGDEDDEDDEDEDGDFQEYTPYGDILGADAEAYQDDEDDDGDFKPDAEPEDFDIPEDEEEEDSVLGKHPRTDTEGA